ncbi:hypothetical protein TNCV_2589331 [Trichonephila clavipes]|nr:hypothetical protein TNCV_2589331 [Trichonephila clavipes]
MVPQVVHDLSAVSERRISRGTVQRRLTKAVVHHCTSSMWVVSAQRCRDKVLEAYVLRLHFMILKRGYTEFTLLMNFSDISRMDWSSRSPVLEVLEELFLSLTALPVTQQLKVTLFEEWALLTQTFISTFINSMAALCEACTAVHDSHTPYTGCKGLADATKDVEEMED